MLDPVERDRVPAVSLADPLPFAPRSDYRRDGLLRSFDESIQHLGRVPNLLLIHDIGERTHGAEGDAAHMAALRSGGFRALDEPRAGGVRAIGIGINEVEIGLALLEEVRLDAILLAGRYTLLDRSAEPLLRRAEAEDVAIVAAGVFNSGILATRGRLDAKFDYLAAPSEVLDRVAALERVAARHGLPLSALAVQCAQRSAAVGTLLLGAASVEDLASSLAGLEAIVPPEAWDDLGALGAPPRRGGPSALP